MKSLVIAFALLAVTAPVRAEPAAGVVALLPLDAERSLEIYGQPIAAEISRSLTASAIQVVVVSAKMAVPDTARLIVDGTITATKAGAITIAIRVRRPSDGRVLGDPLIATAPGLAQLDSATSELSARLLPVVQTQLVALRAPAMDHGRVVQTPGVAAGDHSVVIAVGDETHSADTAALVAALEPAVVDWTRAHHRQVQKVEPTKLDAKTAVKTAGTSDFAIGLWVLRYDREVLDGVPVARAKVRVRIAGGASISFDRVVVTDTVLGDKGLAPAELAARVSREVLAILRPHVLRRVRAWE